MSGATAVVGHIPVIVDDGCRGTGLVTPHRPEAGQAELPVWKEEHNRSHRKVCSRVEHTFARMKGWKIRCGCRLKVTVSTRRCPASHTSTTSPSLLVSGKHQAVVEPDLTSER